MSPARDHTRHLRHIPHSIKTSQGERAMQESSQLGTVRLADEVGQGRKGSRKRGRALRRDNFLKGD